MWNFGVLIQEVLDYLSVTLVRVQKEIPIYIYGRLFNESLQYQLGSSSMTILNCVFKSPASLSSTDLVVQLKNKHDGTNISITSCVFNSQTSLINGDPRVVTKEILNSTGVALVCCNSKNISDSILRNAGT